MVYQSAKCISTECFAQPIHEVFFPRKFGTVRYVISSQSLPADGGGPLEVLLAVEGEKVAALLQANGYADHARAESREEENMEAYLPPVPPDKEEFVVSVTYVNQEGVIYGHILREGECGFD